MGASLHRGSPSMRDYTPGSAVTAGQVIAIGLLNCIAHRDIAANELGALAVPAGTAAYKIPTDQNISDGDAVLINTTSGIADGTGVMIGYAEGDADGSGTPTDVVVTHMPYVGVVPGP